MAWGDPFKRAWQSAGDAGRAAAQATARGATRAWTKTKELAAQADEAARVISRDAQRGITDGGYDAVAATAETVRQGAAKVASAYAKAKEKFTGKPAGSPVEPCAGDTATPGNDKSKDGWMIAPQGEGRPCLAYPPPPKAALAQAREHAVQSDSACCQGAHARQGSRDIIYVNGIMTTAQTHCATLNAIAAQTCARVVGVYNAKVGAVADAMQTGQDRRLIKAAQAGKRVPVGDGRNPAVDTLSRTVSNELREGRKPEIWAHSQGGAVTSLALLDAKNDRQAATLDPDPLRGIKVKSFGSAAPSWTDGPSYQHFIHVNDPVPTDFGIGHAATNDAAIKGAGAEIIRFSGKPGEIGSLTADAKLDYLGKDIGNHDVINSYLLMEKKRNGGCS